MNWYSNREGERFLKISPYELSRDASLDWCLEKETDSMSFL
ncbi:hypothetical protein ACFPQ1_28615 [Rhodocytophaga aerolata]